MHLCVNSMLPSKFISKLTPSQPPSALMSSLHLGLEVYLQRCSFAASKYIIQEWWRVYGDTGVMEVNRVMGSIDSAGPRVKRHHLISIPSYQRMKIHTIFHNFWSHSLCPKSSGSSMSGSIISSHSISTSLEPEQLIFMNSVSMS